MTALPLDSSTSPAADDPDLAASLQQRLADRLSSLRRRANGSASLERRIAIGGAVLAAAGAVLVGLGWYGAAHTSRVYLQIPYLISGGLLGVVLAVAGGCAYLASWLTRLVHDQQARADEAVAAARETAAALTRIETLLAASAATGSGPVAPGEAAPALVATPSGRLAHLPSCPTVTGRNDLRPATVGVDGMAQCRMCRAEPDAG